MPTSRALDPAVANDTNSIPFVRMMFQPLLEYDDGVNLTPLLAEAMPELSEDGKVYTFHIRKGIHFSNGREVTADDFIYAWKRILDPKDQIAWPDLHRRRSPAAPGSTSIGKRSRRSGSADTALTPEEEKTPHAETVSGLRALDAYTLEVELVHPDATFLYVVAMTYLAPVPREEIEKYPEKDRNDEFAVHPVGSGPFVLKEWRRSLRMRLERDPHYWGPNPPGLQTLDVKFGLDDLTMQMMFERGELDLMDSIPSAAYVRLKKDPRWQPYFEKLVFNGEYFLTMNCEMEPFNGPNGATARRPFVTPSTRNASSKSAMTATSPPRASCLRKCRATNPRLQDIHAIPKRRKRCSPRPAIPTACRSH